MTNSEELENAAFHGDATRIAELLNQGASIDCKGRNWTPLHAAIENENFECVKLLLDRGADVHDKSPGFTPLNHAVDIAIDGTIQIGGDQGDEPTEIIELLIAYGADPASGIDTARSYASRKVTDLLESEIKKRG